jgi:hypothetical protein
MRARLVITTSAILITAGYRGRVDAYFKDGKLERATDKLDVELY